MNDNISAFNSKKYDEEIKHTLPYYDEFYKQVIDVISNYKSKPLTWLDIGCGTGKMAELAYKETEIEKFVFLDNSSEMIKIARSRFNYSNSDFIISDVRDINYNNDFDIITAIQVNHYLTYKDRISVIKKCYEALNPGGIFMTFENFAPSSELTQKLYLKRWKSYQLKHGNSHIECNNHINRYNKNYFPIQISEHFKILKDNGFKAAEILWLSYMQVGILAIK